MHLINFSIRKNRKSIASSGHESQSIANSMSQPLNNQIETLEGALLNFRAEITKKIEFKRNNYNISRK